MAEEKQDFILKDEKEPAGDRPATEKKSGDQTAGKGTKATAFQMPAINFATFIFSLNSSVLVHLGIIEDPATGKKGKDLAMAKQTIDILAMLLEKTRGNLSNDEENMLKSMLYDLRMLYVKEKE
jgi:hypothetical protein